MMWLLIIGSHFSILKIESGGYEMRKLIGKDAFAVARIIKKSGIKNELAELEFNGDYSKLGLKVFITIFETLSSQGLEQEVFAFLNDILGVEDTSNMDIFELIELIKEYAKANDLKRFLSLVGSTL